MEGEQTTIRLPSELKEKQSKGHHHKANPNNCHNQAHWGIDNISYQAGRMRYKGGNSLV